MPRRTDVLVAVGLVAAMPHLIADVQDVEVYPNECWRIF